MQILIHYVWDVTCDSAFLTSSQVMAVILVYGTPFAFHGWDVKCAQSGLTLKGFIL